MVYILVFVEDGGRSIIACWCGSIGASWPGTIIAFRSPASWTTSGASSGATDGGGSWSIVIVIVFSLGRDDDDGSEQDSDQEDLHLLAMNVKLEM